MAALDCALHAALIVLPAEQAGELKRTFGRVMGEIVLEISNPTVKAFPELALDDSTWAAVARVRTQAIIGRLIIYPSKLLPST